MNSELVQKEKDAIERLKAFEPKDGEPYYLCYSGGKDSDVIRYSTRKQICYPIWYPDMLIYSIHCAAKGNHKEASGAIERVKYRKRKLNLFCQKRSQNRLQRCSA